VRLVAPEPVKFFVKRSVFYTCGGVYDGKPCSYTFDMPLAMLSMVQGAPSERRPWPYSLGPVIAGVTQCPICGSVLKAEARE